MWVLQRVGLFLDDKKETYCPPHYTGPPPPACPTKTVTIGTIWLDGTASPAMQCDKWVDIVHMGSVRGILDARVLVWAINPGHPTYAFQYALATIAFETFDAVAPGSAGVAPWVRPDSDADDILWDFTNRGPGNHSDDYWTPLKTPVYVTANTVYRVTLAQEYSRPVPITSTCEEDWQLTVKV